MNGIDQSFVDLARRARIGAVFCALALVVLALAPPTAAQNASNFSHLSQLPLSVQDQTAIRERVARYWNIDAGARGVETFAVELRVWVAVDGTVTGARIERVEGDENSSRGPFAQSALLSVLRASPLPMPPTNAHQLLDGNLKLVFRASDFLGRDRPLSVADQDAIRRRVSQFWNIDAGARGVETFAVDLRVWVLTDGTVQDVRIERVTGDDNTFRQSFADSARRAVLRASPLPMPANNAQQMLNGNLTLAFRAAEMLGQRR